MGLAPLLLAFLLASPAHANQVKYLPNAASAIAEYVSAIRGAQTKIDLTYYIWDPCSEIGRVIIREIERKQESRKKQGLPPLPVRLVIDASQHEPQYRPAMQAAMAKRGIQMKFFNDSAVWDPRRNLRTHIKFLAVDGNKTISGGRNISDDYYGLTSGQNWIDREALIQGPGAAAANASMDELWGDRFTFSEPKPATAEEIKQHETKCLAPSKRVLDIEKYLNANMAALLGKNSFVSCPAAHFVADRPDFTETMDSFNPASEGENREYLHGERLARKRFTDQLLKALGKTTRSAKIENYSYIPPSAIRQNFERLRRAGKPVTVITNLAAEDDQMIMVPALMHYQNADALGTQKIMRVPHSKIVNDNWAMTPGNPTYKIHSKIFILDKKDTFVSAFNIDPRSFHTNLESGISAPNCPAFAAKVEEAMDATYSRMQKILSTPGAIECFESLAPTPDRLDIFLSWAVHELL